VTLRGAVVGEAEAMPGMFLAINPGGATQQLPGARTTDPAFGLPAVWIEERHRKWPKWPALRWLIAPPSWPPIFHT
jgi:flagellar biosynthesis protein FlhA